MVWIEFDLHKPAADRPIRRLHELRLPCLKTYQIICTSQINLKEKICTLSTIYKYICLQVGFIGGICLPCYDLLVKVLPNTAPMQEQCTYNLNVWKAKAEERNNQLQIKEENQEEEEKESTKEE